MTLELIIFVCYVFGYIYCWSYTNDLYNKTIEAINEKPFKTKDEKLLIEILQDKKKRKQNLLIVSFLWPFVLFGHIRQYFKYRKIKQEIKKLNKRN